MHAHVESPDPALDTGLGPYHVMDDLGCAHENSGSILVTHRVDQVTSKKADPAAAAKEVEDGADGSGWI